MNKRAIWLILGLVFSSAAVAEKISFKQGFEPQPHWFFSLFSLLALLVVLIILSKRKKTNYSGQTSCQVVEQKRLNAKTMIFVIEYQQQQFLLAENQQALSWHRILPACRALCPASRDPENKAIEPGDWPE